MSKINPRAARNFDRATVRQAQKLVDVMNKLGYDSIVGHETTLQIADLTSIRYKGIADKTNFVKDLYQGAQIGNPNITKPVIKSFAGGNTFNQLMKKFPGFKGKIKGQGGYEPQYRDNFGSGELLRAMGLVYDSKAPHKYRYMSDEEKLRDGGFDL